MANATEELERGRQAAEVLENPVYRDAMAQLQTEVLNKWQNDKDAAVRDWLWSMMQACKRLDKVLLETMQTGQLRSQQIEMERSRAERLGATLRRTFTG